MKKQDSHFEADSDLDGAPEAAGWSDEDDDAFLDLIAGRLTESQRNEMELLEKVKAVYVPCGRDKVIEEMLNDFVVSMLAKKDNRRDDGRIFFITGESGAGKTSLIARALSRNPALQPQVRSFGEVRPVASVSLSGGAVTLKMVGHQIAQSVGYPLKTTVGQSELWHRLPEILHQRRILIVHIDETQHVLRRTESDLERKNLAKSIKGLANYSNWPVSFILSGTPETTEIARLDEQFERRGKFLSLPDVAMPEERVLVERLIRAMAGAIDMSTERLINSDVPDRIAHAARYRYGRIAQVILSGIHVAIRKGAMELTREHFARAYLELSHARGRDDMNPFLADDWQRLQPGYFLNEERRNG